MRDPRPPAASLPSYLRTFESFSFAPFRWYFGALIGWQAAMNMQMLVRGYLVFDLTGSYAKLGVIGLASAFPMLLLSPWGGVVADRAPSKRTVLQVGQLGSMVVSIVVAVLLFADQLTFAHLFGASVAQGTVMALVMPSRQALLPEVVGLDRLMNAVPLNAAGMNIMRMIGPALGGWLIVALSPGWVYAVMSGLYLLSVVVLFGVTTTPVDPERAAERAARRGRGEQSGGIADLGEGLRYIWRDRVIFVLLVMSFFTSVLAMPYMMMLPGYVADVFEGNAVALGTMTAASGVGALAGALLLATVRIRRPGLMLILGAAFLGASLVAFTMTASFWPAAVLIAAVGLGTALRQSLAQVLLQTHVDDAYRGRVMSIFMTQFSLMQFGVFFVGLYSDALGPRFALGSLGGALVVVSLLILVTVPRLRDLR